MAKTDEAASKIIEILSELQAIKVSILGPINEPSDYVVPSFRGDGLPKHDIGEGKYYLFDAQK